MRSLLSSYRIHTTTNVIACQGRRLNLLPLFVFFVNLARKLIRYLDFPSLPSPRGRHD
jgi:hypothetical protein